MKTIRTIGLTIMMVLVCGLFTACGNDDDDEGGGSDSIFGTWVPDMSPKKNYRSLFDYFHSSYLTIESLKFKKDGTWEEKGTEGIDCEYRIISRGIFTINTESHRVTIVLQEMEEDGKKRNIETDRIFDYSVTGNVLIIEDYKYRRK